MTKQENSKNIISLNPYSTGSNSNMTIATVLNTQGKRLNPYSTGSNSNFFVFDNVSVLFHCLNPYSTGSNSNQLLKL